MKQVLINSLQKVVGSYRLHGRVHEEPGVSSRPHCPPQGRALQTYFYFLLSSLPLT